MERQPATSTGLPCAIVADLLREARFEALDLAANVPAASFLDPAQNANRLVAVMIGATTPGRAHAVRAGIRALRGGGVAVPILVGGGAIESEAHTRRLRARPVGPVPMPETPSPPRKRHHVAR